ncbi:MAG: hypothetical protein ACEQSX_00375 [Baekduiaceae bacterium]
MPITDRLMQTGSWGLELVPRTPDYVRRAMARLGSQVYFTATDIPDENLDVDGLRAAAFYAGVVTRRARRSLRYGGPNLLGFTVSAKGGIGVTGGAVSPALPYTFTQAIQDWVTTATSNSNGIGYGTAFSPTATTVNDVVPFATLPPFKSAFDTLAKQTGNEYVLRPTGLMDFGVSTALFNTNPTVLIAPGLAGREGNFKALEVDGSWDPEGDIDSFRNYGFTVQDDRFTNANAVSNLANRVRFATFNDPTTAVAFVSDPIFTNSDDFTDISNQAQAAANEFSAEHLTLPARVREYCLHRLAIPGDWVWVYDTEADIVDRTNPQYFQGDVIFPQALRLMGFTSPVECGMGVRVVSGEVIASGDAEIINVTNYVRWERDATSLELDSTPYRLQDVGGRSVLR